MLCSVLFGLMIGSTQSMDAYEGWRENLFGNLDHPLSTTNTPDATVAQQFENFKREVTRIEEDLLHLVCDPEIQSPALRRGMMRIICRTFTRKSILGRPSWKEQEALDTNLNKRENENAPAANQSNENKANIISKTSLIFVSFVSVFTFVIAVCFNWQYS